MHKGLWIALALMGPLTARANEPSAAQQVSDRAAQNVASMLDALRGALGELQQLRSVSHPPASACLEPLEGLRAYVREAQAAHLELEGALAADDEPHANAALLRVDHGRRRALELQGQVHACVERVLRASPVKAWARTETAVVEPIHAGVDPTRAPWPPAPVGVTASR